jgi:hypothetical protein
MKNTNYKKIKTMPAVYAACGVEKKPDVSSFPEFIRDYMANHFDIIMMARAINTRDDGSIYEPNWNDSSDKWQVWVWPEASEEQPGGFGFSRSTYGRWNADTTCGSRLCFETEEQLDHAFKNFPEQFKQNFLIMKSSNEHKAVPK